MQRARLTAVLLTTVFCVLASAPASAIASPPDATTEAATAVSYEEATLKGSVNPLGTATSYWFEYGETTSYGTKIPASPKSVGSGSSNVLVNNLVTGLKESTTYHFRVVAESEEGMTNGNDVTFTTCGFNFSFGKSGSGEGQLSEPFGIALDSKGNVWVSDTGNNRIEEFNEKGEYLSQFGKKGTSNGEFEAPKGIAIDSEDQIWVVDSGNNRIQEFDATGKFLRKAGEKGSGEAQFESPTGITIESSGNRPYVADTGNNRIEKFNKEGKYVTAFGKAGAGDGELASPEGVLKDAKARLWIVDTGNDRVQRFNPSNFAFFSKFCEVGTGNGHCKSPIGITADFQEKVWVADSGNDRAQKFDIGGNYLDKVGEKGAGSGQLTGPMGVVAPAPQKLLILDSGNDRVESWTVKAEPPTASTGIAVGIKATSATVPATINPQALATAYWFEYGETTSYGTKIPVSPESVGSGLAGVSVEKTITGLKEGTKYRFRVVAESAAGSSAGIDRGFTTLKLPDVTTEAATAIKTTQATLNGKVNPLGSATKYWFEYGETESYGTKIPASPESIGAGSEYVAVSKTLTGLKEGMTYYFRVAAESEAEPGKVISGTGKSFTTLKLPDVTTEAATAIKTTQATLNGKVNPLGSATKYWFEYGETTSYGTKIPVSPESVGSGTEYVPVSQTPTGLKEGTEYHYRVVAESEAGKVNGADKSFTTLKLLDATTEAATAVKTTQATLNGKVNPLGLATTYWFEYGKTESYGTKIPVSPESAGSGTEYIPVSQTPTGLKEGTEYHYRVVAESEAGKVNGADKSFKTLKLPDAKTEAPTPISSEEATLNGKVNPLGLATTYWFEYGKTESYGTKIPVSPESAGSGTEYIPVSQTPTGLKEGTEYHYRVVAESEAGKVNGADKSFTVGPPDAITEPAIVKGAFRATLNGKVNPLGLATTYWFEYGKTESYGTKIPVFPESIGAGSEYVAVSKTPTGLSEGTEYHFRVVAENEMELVGIGEDKTFVTEVGGWTVLCAEDEELCSEPITHVHETTLSGHKAELLSSVLEVECDTLFLGDALGGGLGSPLIIHGTFTYSNCNNSCTATEENGPAEIEIAKEGNELASVAGEGLVHLNCPSFINCRYVGTGLEGHALGALTSSELNGSVALSEQVVAKESGSLCPTTSRLDITTTPLEKTYITE